MDKLGFLFSKKILLILSGLIFTGVAFASSGTENLFVNYPISPEIKIPNVEKLSSPSSTPSASPTEMSKKQGSSIKPQTSASTPKPTLNPKPTTTPGTQPTITGLKKAGGFNGSELENEKEEGDPEDSEDSEDSEISKAFQKAKDED